MRKAQPWKLRKWIHIALLTSIGFTAFATVAPEHSEAATEESTALISFGEKYIGTPYQFGVRSGTTTAFDCSSFIQYVFKKSGVSLPRTSQAQANVGVKVAKSNLSVGDLIFFKTNGKSISHVGIYAGNNKMLHSSSSAGVTLSKIDSSYWTKSYVTARRVSL